MDGLRWCRGGVCLVVIGMSAAACGDDTGSSAESDPSTGVAETSTGAPSGSSESSGATEGSNSTGDPSTGTTQGVDTEVDPTEADSSTGDEPTIPAACEAVGLPLEQGQETQTGHFGTVADFDAEDLEQWLGEVPAPDRGILVLATHTEYDCNYLFDDLNTSYPFSQQVVYVFDGPIEVGTFVLGEGVRAWRADWLGDGGGNGGGGSGELTDESITIVSVDDGCVTGIKPFSESVDYGFAVGADATCG